MIKITLAAALLALLPLRARAEGAFEQVRRCADGACWQSRDVQSLPPDATGTLSEGLKATLSPARASKNKLDGCGVPAPKASKKSAQKKAAKKSSKKKLLVAAAAVGGAFLIGGPAGAEGALLLLLILPKLFGLFHHKKSAKKT